MPNEPESPAPTPRPKARIHLGPVKLDLALGQQLEDARASRGVKSKQSMLRQALRLWLADGGKPISRPTAGHRILWLTEKVRRQLNFQLPRDAPKYLGQSIQHVYQLVSRPRGIVYDFTGDFCASPSATSEDLPRLERLTGTSPRARWLWDESPAGVVVREADLHYLDSIPGVITTFKKVDRGSHTLVEIGW